MALVEEVSFSAAMLSLKALQCYQDHELNVCSLLSRTALCGGGRSAAKMRILNSLFLMLKWRSSKQGSEWHCCPGVCFCCTVGVKCSSRALGWGWWVSNPCPACSMAQCSFLFFFKVWDFSATCAQGPFSGELCFLFVKNFSRVGAWDFSLRRAEAAWLQPEAQGCIQLAPGEFPLPRGCPWGVGGRQGSLLPPRSVTSHRTSIWLMDPDARSELRTVGQEEPCREGAAWARARAAIH